MFLFLCCFFVVCVFVLFLCLCASNHDAERACMISFTKAGVTCLTARMGGLSKDAAQLHVK